MKGREQKANTDIGTKNRETRGEWGECRGWSGWPGGQTKTPSLASEMGREGNWVESGFYVTSFNHMGLAAEMQGGTTGGREKMPIGHTATLKNLAEALFVPEIPPKAKARNIAQLGT